MRTCWLGVLLAAGLLAGCSSSPPLFDPAVEQARGEVQAAAADSDVVQFARSELELAQDAFAQAERNWRRRNDRDVIAHWAYLAQQRAATAREAGRLRRAEAAARTAEAERQARQVEVSTPAPAPALSGAAEPSAPIDEALERHAARGLTVTLGDELFARDGVELDRRAEPTIERIATLLRQDPSRTARIEGHADESGNPSRDLELSGRRGDAIRAALVARGIDARRLQVVALGDSFPVASNDTELGRVRNRRVEVVIVSPVAPARLSAPQ
jgi:outer membrane protein OmpA-like peptidoglycan-associated protein